MDRDNILYDFNPFKLIDTFLFANTWSVLEKVSDVLEKNVHSAVFWMQGSISSC